MASQVKPETVEVTVPNQLFSVGAPVVVAADGTRVQLGGELSADHRKQLGDGKIRSLMIAGHLQTQEQIDEAERVRLESLKNRQDSAGRINPNFGTPSMTPEALEKSGANPEVAGRREPSDKREPGGSDVGHRPITDLEVTPATLAALQDAGCRTVGDMVALAEKHKGLAGKVTNIGEARETEIREAYEKLVKSQQ